MIPIPGYAIGDLLSDNGRTQVYRALREADRKKVLLKIMIGAYASPRHLAGLRNEHHIASSLRMQAAVRPLELCPLPDGLALVFPDQGGRSLDALLQGGPLPLSRFLSLARLIAEALAELHREEVIHKDIKPHNLIVSPDEQTVWIADFGLATRLQRDHQGARDPDEIQGTLPYMSPEQTGRMNRALDWRTDLYSLGATFYEMLTGATPFARLAPAPAGPIEWIHAHVARAPTPLVQVLHDLPAVVSDIVMRLLAKVPEDRYQSAGGVAHDLGRCLIGWTETRTIAPFSLGRRDRSGRFQVPQTLHGREAEIAALLATFDKVASTGATGLALITGASGIGKSTVVQELHRPLLESRGQLLSAKFDPFNQGTPYAPIVQALRVYLRKLISRGQGQALSGDAGLLAELVPELGPMLDTPKDVVSASPQEAQIRTLRAFAHLLSVFATKEHPLVLFLDDLQWADPASLRLLPFLLTQPEACYLLIIGAYRDNEVGAGHPLKLTLQEIEATTTPCRLHLGPLQIEAVRALVSAAVQRPAEEKECHELSALVYKKTGGNPFFLGQFLQTLYRDGLLFAREGDETGRLSWDLLRIERAAVTDNVVEMMAGRIRHLAERTQAALRMAACLGASFDPAILGAVLGRSPEEMEKDLWPAQAMELIVLGQDGADSHRFYHDRIQQAALSLIPPEEVPALHLLIGRTLSAGGTDLFAIAGHLNAGAALIADQEERLRLMRLDLLCGQRARHSGAFAEAAVFLRAGLTLMGDAAFSADYDTAFALHLLLCECAHLCGLQEEADVLLARGQAGARDDVDRAEVLCLAAAMHVDAGRCPPAIGPCLAGLGFLGFPLPATPTDWAAAVPGALGKLAGLFGDPDIEALYDRPRATERRYHIAGRLLCMLQICGYEADPALFILSATTAAEVFFQGGLTADAPYALAACGTLLLTAFSDYDRGWRLGQIAMRLLEKPGLCTRKGWTYAVTTSLLHFWRAPISETIVLQRHGLQLAIHAGDVWSASVQWLVVVMTQLWTGRPLDALEAEADDALACIGKLGNGFGSVPILLFRQTIRALRGRSAGPTDLSDGSFDEAHFAAASVDGKADYPSMLYVSLKLMLAIVHGDLVLAQEMARQCQARCWMYTGTYYSGLFALHKVLLWGATPKDEFRVAQAQEECQTLTAYAAQCAATFGAMNALGQAVLHGMRGEGPEAARCFEEAIVQAQKDGDLHLLSLANENAGRFYAAQGRAATARGYLQAAWEGYVRWGAEAKADRLSRELRLVAKASTDPSTTLSMRSGQLDGMAAIKASQALSTEIVLHRLTRTLLQIAIENAGAQRGCLVMLRKDGPRTEASIGPAEELPRAIVDHVAGTRDKVLLEDGSADHAFSADPYFTQHRPRSVLCLPLARRGEVLGMLYLENNLAPGAFSADRVALLEVLMSQAAISIENAEVYEELEERVKERTQELRETQKELVSTARRAGMAEIATGILHNVGNALNSVNVSATVIEERVQRSRVAGLGKATALLKARQADLPTFLTTDDKGRKLPDFLIKVGEALLAEQREVLTEVRALIQGVEHIREIVRTQQSYAGSVSMREAVLLESLVEDALRIGGPTLVRHGVQVVREFQPMPELAADKHKVVQILINLISNAKDAMEGNPEAERVMTVRISGDERTARIALCDRGCGIAAEDMQKIFAHGYTTKKEGHGFGLHTSVLAAREMKGDLRAESAGTGCGATFVLELPRAADL